MTEFKRGNTYSYDPNTKKFKLAPNPNTKGMTVRQKQIQIKKEKNRQNPFKENYG